MSPAPGSHSDRSEAHLCNRPVLADRSLKTPPAYLDEVSSTVAARRLSAVRNIYGLLQPSARLANEQSAALSFVA